MRTQILVEVFQILKMLLWLGYLRWKFRLYPPVLCSVRNVSWIDNVVLSVGCLDINWKSKSHWLCEAEVHNQTATPLRRSTLFLTSLWSTRTTSGTIWPFIDLSVTSVSFGYGRLLFDRGKMLDRGLRKLARVEFYMGLYQGLCCHFYHHVHT